MIECICGLIGAGKSTFAKARGGVLSDLDEIKNKKKQIEYTLENLKKGEKVYHITCYPTQNELEVFSKYCVKYVWINTDKSKCKRNIMERGRKRDIDRLQETFQKNEELYNKYLHSKIGFAIVDVFESNERW